MSNEELSSGPKPARFARPAAFAGAGLLAGVIIAGTLSASAQSSTPPATPAVPPATAPSASAAPAPGTRRIPMPGVGHDMRRGKGQGHQEGMGGGVLHGEFVSVKPGGGYQTMQMQRGTATAVSATAITVKSEDGFTRSYAVTKDTLVNAARDGITSVAVSDVVHVRASGAGDKATATDVMDQTKMMANREKFGMDREKQTADATPSNT